MKSSLAIFSFLVGVLFTIVVAYLLLAVFNLSTEKDSLAIIISGVVSISALGFGYINNKEQREVQIVTTIGKDWVEKVRSYIATCCYHSNTLATYVSNHYDRTNPAANEIKVAYDLAYNQFTGSMHSLGLYLDTFKKGNEKELFDLMVQLSEQVNQQGNIDKANTLMELIRRKAQQVLREKILE